mmetsp:Transcript_1868/g.4086  ORF Transcript_1868/g.4086 Transcript_1868/m.4086 type:complete len:231 (-) Transcript_1868:568-1260(-)
MRSGWRRRCWGSCSRRRWRCCCRRCGRDRRRSRLRRSGHRRRGRFRSRRSRTRWRCRTLLVRWLVNLSGGLLGVTKVLVDVLRICQFLASLRKPINHVKLLGDHRRRKHSLSVKTKPALRHTSTLPHDHSTIDVHSITLIELPKRKRIRDRWMHLDGLINIFKINSECTLHDCRVLLWLRKNFANNGLLLRKRLLRHLRGQLGSSIRCCSGGSSSVRSATRSGSRLRAID